MTVVLGTDERLENVSLYSIFLGNIYSDFPGLPRKRYTVRM